MTLTPVKTVRLHGAYSKLQADNTIPIRAPQDFTVLDSVNREDGELWEAGLGLKLDKVAIDGFWSRFANEGSYEYRLYRGGARVDFDATAQRRAHRRVVGRPVPRLSDLDVQLPRESLRRLPQVAPLKRSHEREKKGPMT